MLKIISANVNGIRSAYKKGFYEYIAASGADIVCVQELKAQEADLSDDMKIRTVCTATGIAPKSAVTAAWRCTANASPTMCKSAWALKNLTGKAVLSVAISASCR